MTVRIHTTAEGSAKAKIGEATSMVCPRGGFQRSLACQNSIIAAALENTQ